jgi:hypothetical protein
VPLQHHQHHAFVPYTIVCLQAVSDVFKVLSQENAALRRAAAGLAVQLLEEHGRASVNRAAEALQVKGICMQLLCVLSLLVICVGASVYVRLMTHGLWKVVVHALGCKLLLLEEHRRASVNRGQRRCRCGGACPRPVMNVVLCCTLPLRVCVGFSVCACLMADGVLKGVELLLLC